MLSELKGLSDADTLIAKLTAILTTSSQLTSEDLKSLKDVIPLQEYDHTHGNAETTDRSVIKTAYDHNLKASKSFESHFRQVYRLWKDKKTAIDWLIVEFDEIEKEAERIFWISDFVKKKSNSVDVSKEMGWLLLLEKQNAEQSFRIKQLEQESHRHRAKYLRRRVKKALEKKLFKDDKTFIAYLKTQEGEVDLSAFAFECPFEEETKEVFRVTALNMKSLSQDQTNRFVRFVQNTSLW